MNSSLFASLEDFDDVENDVAIDETEVDNVLDTSDVGEVSEEVTEDIAITQNDAASIESYLRVIDSMESLHTTLKDTLATGGLSKDSAIMMNHAMEGYAIAMGLQFRDEMLPSVENYGSSDSRALSTEISLESVADSISSAGKYVWDKLVKMWNWITEKVSGLFNPLKNLYNKIDALERMIRDKGWTYDGDMYSIPTYLNDLVKSGTLDSAAFRSYSEKCLEVIQQVTEYENLADELASEHAKLSSKLNGKGNKEQLKLKAKLDKLLKDAQETTSLAGDALEAGSNGLIKDKEELKKSASSNAGKVALTTAKVLGFVRDLKEFVKKAMSWKTYTDKFTRIRDKFKNMGKPSSGENDPEASGIMNKAKSVFTKFGNFFHRIWGGLVKKVTGAYKWVVGIFKRKTGKSDSE